MLTGGLVLAAPVPVWAAVPTLNVEDPGMTDLLLIGPDAYRSGHLGTRLAKGDFNGDGIDDLALSGPSMNSPTGVVRAGRVYLLFGGIGVRNLPAELNTQDGFADVAMHGGQEKERVGELLAGGDLNADGYDDLVMVGQNNPPYNEGTTGIARMYVVYGRAEFPSQMALANEADVVIERSRAPGVAGTWPTMQVSALALGDVNGDQVDDLVFSDKVNNLFVIKYGQSGNWAREQDIAVTADVVLRHSGADNLLSTAYFPLYSQQEIAGVAVGDWNNDGLGDLALGVPNESANGLANAGRVYVLHGRADFPAEISLDQAADSIITGACVKDKVGGPLASGDVNADRRDDLLIGAPFSQRCLSNSTGLGKVQVLYGRTGGLGASRDLANQADVTLSVSGDGDPDSGSLARIGFKTGYALLAEDVDGDRVDDIVISTPAAFLNRGENGWVHVVRGRRDLGDTYLLDQQADLWVLTPEPTGPRLIAGRLGESVAVLDLNLDGKPDLVMGAPEGLAADGGFVPILYNPFAKTATLAAVGTLNPADLSLNLAQVNAGTLGSLQVTLRFTPEGLFELAGYQPVPADTHAQPANFDAASGVVSIPAVQFGGLRVKNVTLQWYPHPTRLLFQITGYEI